ncbi:hypothetical protein [Stenotrophomonas maltophilia]|uniref:hypothetical protein n=1 Tax=Stenotrophomonas maltophilia TaxID=40324 RepID=UPI001D0FCD92|nr:hypothetical protein [Stenotrophomonas maltophilia]UXB35964.1 hypothetical protein K7563_18895 [Stenotrophomonas maltophilia]
MKGLRINTIFSIAALCLSALSLYIAYSSRDSSRVLEARGLVIRDASGVSRVEIGAPVSDPMVHGERGPRAAPASGIILNGPDGNERGGYLTVDSGDEALFTLDGAGDAKEVFKVVANEAAGASLFLIHQNGAAAMLTTYQGHPELQFFESDGSVSYAQGAKE